MNTPSLAWKCDLQASAQNTALKDTWQFQIEISPKNIRLLIEYLISDLIILSARSHLAVNSQKVRELRINESFLVR